MPELPKLPKLPRISDFIKRGNPLREVVEDARQVIKTGREEISEVASAIRAGKPAVEPEPPIAQEEPIAIQEDEIKGGTAGKLCTDEHVSQVAADLKEALRMARSRGIKDREVRDRLLAARDELNAMERYDMVAEKIAQYTPDEQSIARWLLPKSAAIRHTVNEILMRDKGIEDLEKLSAFASNAARELTDRIDALPEEQKASDECLVVKGLSTFLEEQKLKRGDIGISDVKKYLGQKGGTSD